MPTPYTLISTGPVNSQFRAIARAAIYAGRGDDVLRAMRQISQLLEHAPLGVGNPMYRLRGMKLRVRNVIVPPLYVEYGVHETEPAVILRFVATFRTPVDLT